VERRWFMKDRYDCEDLFNIKTLLELMGIASLSELYEKEIHSQVSYDVDDLLL